MNKTRTIINWSVLLLILLLILFSIYGAFIGANRAQAFFNSAPLIIYWISFMALLILGFIFLKRLLKSPPLLLIHLGCILVLLGAMWGSKAGHQIQQRIFNIHKLQTGNMIVYEGMSENRVLCKNTYLNFAVIEKQLKFFGNDKASTPVDDNDARLFTLPFQIKLNDFRIEYYQQPRLLVSDTKGNQTLLEDLKAGAKYQLGDKAQLTIEEIFSNLKVRKMNGKMQVYDDSGSGSNPAVKIIILSKDGTKEEIVTFANYPGHMGSSEKYSVQYAVSGMIKDYFSDVQVIDKGKVVKEKSIQVNDPLYYKGYHIYQQNYDQNEEKYSVLSISSDSGLYLVYAGYLMLIIGITWLMWIIPLLRTQTTINK